MRIELHIGLMLSALCSVYAARADAQMKAKFMLSFHSAMTVPANSFSEFSVDNQHDSIGGIEPLFLGCDFTTNVTNPDSVYIRPDTTLPITYYVQFIVDTIGHMIRHLEIYQSEGGLINFGVYPGGQFGSTNRQVFDSIPIKWGRQGVFETLGGLALCSYSCDSQFQNFAGGGPSGRGYFHTRNAHGVSVDTLSITSRPLLESVANPVIKSLISLGDPTTIFPNLSAPALKGLVVYNSCGMSVYCSGYQSGEQNWVAFCDHLPSGLYFARLGDQVAKFVVPPR